MEDKRWQSSKIYTLKKDANSSLQMHHQELEHWVVVKGTALRSILMEIN